MRSGLSSTRKTVTVWNESSRGQGLEIRRYEKSLRELVLFSLENLGAAGSHLGVVVEGQSLSDGEGMRGNRHKLERREFPLEITKSFFLP